MNISWSMKHTAVWHHRNGYNQSGGGAKYDDPQEIKCRFELRRTMVRNKEGAEIVSDSRCFTDAQVCVDDLLIYDGIEHIIQSVEAPTSLYSAQASYRIAYM